MRLYRTTNSDIAKKIFNNSAVVFNEIDASYLQLKQTGMIDCHKF